MKTLPRLALWAAVLSIVALCAWGASGLTHHAIMALDKWGDAGAKLSATLDAVNAPCKGFHGSETCGVLAQAAQTEKNVGILAGQGAEQVKQSAVLVQTTAKAINGASNDVHQLSARLSGTADALTGTANASTGTLQTASTALGNANESIAALQPLISGLQRDSDDLDSLIRRPTIGQTIDNTATISHNFALTTTDFETRFHAILYPPPCKTFGCKMAKAWPIIREVPALGESLYWTDQLITQTAPK